MIEFPFPGDIGPANDVKPDKYWIFPEEHENHESTVFHGTNWWAFEEIKKRGFQPAGELPSTSFAYNSQYALEYACKKRSLGSPGVVIIVRFKPEQNVVKEAGAHWHLYDHGNSQPEIIGFCKIPDEYQHR